MTAPLRLFNSLTRELEAFAPIHEGEARVCSRGPTVCNYPHIGTVRASVFAGVLVTRALAAAQQRGTIIEQLAGLFETD